MTISARSGRMLGLSYTVATSDPSSLIPPPSSLPFHVLSPLTFPSFPPAFRYTLLCIYPEHVGHLYIMWKRWSAAGADARLLFRAVRNTCILRPNTNLHCAMLYGTHPSSYRPTCTAQCCTEITNMSRKNIKISNKNFQDYRKRNQLSDRLMNYYLKI